LTETPGPWISEEKTHTSHKALASYQRPQRARLLSSTFGSRTGLLKPIWLARWIMALLVTCSCGHQFYTPPDPAGQSRPCPACGHRSILEAQFKEWRVPWGPVLGALVILAGGIGFACGMIYVLHPARPGVASQTWPTTQGVVLAHERHFLRRNGGIWPYYYEGFLVKYTYQVAGVVYVNNRRSFRERDVEADGFSENEGGRRELNERYPPGGPCTVYYNPDNPAESCLEPGAGPTAFVLGTVSALLLGLGILFLVTAIRRPLCAKRSFRT
jgi:hypothetical protein